MQRQVCTATPTTDTFATKGGVLTHSVMPCYGVVIDMKSKRLPKGAAWIKELQQGVSEEERVREKQKIRERYKDKLQRRSDTKREREKERKIEKEL